MRNELYNIYKVVLKYDIDKLAEPSDFETEENKKVVKYLEALTSQVKEVAEAQEREDNE